MKTTCTRDEYERLSAEEQDALAAALLAFIRQQHSDQEFGYESFPMLRYDHMVLSTLFHQLKEQGQIESSGYMTFRLAGRPEGSAIDMARGKGHAEVVEFLQRATGSQPTLGETTPIARAPECTTSSPTKSPSAPSAEPPEPFPARAQPTVEALLGVESGRVRWRQVVAFTVGLVAARSLTGLSPAAMALGLAEAVCILVAIRLAPRPWVAIVSSAVAFGVIAAVVGLGGRTGLLGVALFLAGLTLGLPRLKWPWMTIVGVSAATDLITGRGAALGAGPLPALAAAAVFTVIVLLPRPLRAVPPRGSSPAKGRAFALRPGGPMRTMPTNGARRRTAPGDAAAEAASRSANAPFISTGGLAVLAALSLIGAGLIYHGASRWPATGGGDGAGAEILGGALLLIPLVLVGLAAARTDWSIPRIRRAEQERDVDALAGELARGGGPAVGAAAKALVLVGTPESAGALLDAWRLLPRARVELSDIISDAPTQASLGEALAGAILIRRDLEAYAPLLRRLGDDRLVRKVVAATTPEQQDAAMRLAAVRVLAHLSIYSETVDRALEACHADPEPQVRASARQALDARRRDLDRAKSELAADLAARERAARHQAQQAPPAPAGEGGPSPRAFDPVSMFVDGLGRGEFFVIPIQAVATEVAISLGQAIVYQSNCQDCAWSIFPGTGRAILVIGEITDMRGSSVRIAAERTAGARVYENREKAE